MKRRDLLFYIMAFCILASLAWGNVNYRRYKYFETELNFREIEIFTDHLYATIRAVETSDPDKLRENLARLNWLGAFDSISMQNGTAKVKTRLVDPYIRSVKKIYDNGIGDYKAIESILNNLSHVLEKTTDELLKGEHGSISKKDMNKLIDELIPIVESFEEETRK